MTFDEAFTSFIGANAVSAELVSDLLPKKVDFPNADYFFQNRKFIVELKGLEEEKYDAVHKICIELLNKGEIPSFQKGMTVKDVIKEHPQKDLIISKMHSKVTSSLVGALEKANRQIRETRHHFKLIDSRGAVVIVNIDNTVLEPKLADGVIDMLMRQKKDDGAYRYEEISFIIYISNVHFQCNGSMPFYVIKRERQFDEVDMRFINEFKDVWGRFRGLPVDDIGPASWKGIREISFLSKNKDFESPEKSSQSKGGH